MKVASKTHIATPTVTPAKPAAVTPSIQRKTESGATSLLYRKPENNFIQPSRLPAFIQTKVAVGSPNDSYEQEADRTAERVMRMPSPSGGMNTSKTSGKVQAKPLFNSITPYLAKKSEEKEKEKIIQKKENGSSPTLSPSVESQLNASKGGGAAMPAATKAFMEPRFGADFSKVKIHTDASAVQMNKQLGAAAFTHGNDIYFNAGQYQPESAAGKTLLAHELTHVVQQGGAVRKKEEVSTRTPEPMVQKLGMSDALDYFADKANNIPGFRMFTIILGVNPINMGKVDRSAANILRAIVEFLPGGALITQALDNHGVFEKVGAWVEKQFAAFANLGASIKQAIKDFLGSLGWSDIFDLGGVWNRAKRIFTEPIGQIISLGKSMVTGILKFIKEAILRPLAKLAEGTAGYDLLKAVMGEDPVTGDPYPQTADNLVGGFMKLIGQEEIYQNAKKANALPRLLTWVKSNLSMLLGFVKQIPGLFMTALQSLEIMDLVLLPRAFIKVGKVFGGFIGQFMSWAGNAVWDLLKIIFEVVAPGAMPYLNKAKAAFKTILKNPIGFLGNLVNAGKAGFNQFKNNFIKHLTAGLIQWLTGTMAGMAIYIPQGLSLIEIFKFVASILGLTWANIRVKLVKAIGETAVVVLEKGFDLVKTLITQGPAAAWQQLMGELNNLKSMVIDQVMDFVKTKVIEVAVTKLLSFLSPVGAFIQAIIGIYNTVMFFVEKIQQIAAVAASFIDSLSAIANGVIGAAANRVEQTMAGMLSLVISFLARFAGLGKVSDKVKEIIEKIRKPIDKAMDKVITWIVEKGKKLFGIGKDKKDASEFDKKAKQVKVAFSMNGESHTISLQKQGDKYKLLMSSNAPGILLSKIGNARAEINENIKNKKPPKKQGQTWNNAIEGLSKQEQDIGYADQYLADFKLQEERTIPNQNLSIAGFESRIAKITSSLERIGTNYGITSLQDIWANDHPSKFVKAKQLLPSYQGSANIRATFYPSMSTLYPTFRNPKLNGSFLSGKNLISGNKNSLTGRVYSGTLTGKLADPDFASTHFISEATYAEESVFNHPKIVINGANYATVPKKGSLDHNNSVAKSWNADGRLKTQTDRETAFKTPPFQLISVELNSSRGSKEPPYDPNVGIDFRGPGE